MRQWPKNSRNVALGNMNKTLCIPKEIFDSRLGAIELRGKIEQLKMSRHEVCCHFMVAFMKNFPQT
jgi:hypothetical protein